MLCKLFLEPSNSSYWGVVHKKTKKILIASDFSGELFVDGFSVISPKHIKRTVKKGAQVSFYLAILNSQGSVPRCPSRLENVENLVEAVGALQGLIAGIDLADDREFLFGYIGAVEEEGFHLTYVRPDGFIEKSNAEWIQFSDVVRVKSGGKYSKAFSAFHRRMGMHP